VEAIADSARRDRIRLEFLGKWSWGSTVEAMRGRAFAAQRASDLSCSELPPVAAPSLEEPMTCVGNLDPEDQRVR
jgi:hypothetical protein